MPMRIATQVLGGQGDVYLARGTWQVGLAYRGSGSSHNIQGNQVQDSLQPHGQATVVRSDAMNLSLAYAVSDRLALTLNVPFSQNSHTRYYADDVRHRNTSSGLGEVSFIANYWLRAAQALQPGGNLAIGIGLKAPGRNDVAGTWWNKAGVASAFPVHPSIQLGDGGWGIIVQTQAFQPIVSRLYLYAAGSYTLSTKDTTDVLRAPPPAKPVYYGVPDVWDARAGASLVLWPDKGLSTSLGVRFDGTPRYDVLGGTDLGFRHPANIGYLDPGLVVTRGGHTVTLNVPIRIYKNFRRSYYELVNGISAGGGLPQNMILVTYSGRFRP
jgi:hypothetical protein